jgi:hypothetical protein
MKMKIERNQNGTQEKKKDIYLKCLPPMIESSQNSRFKIREIHRYSQILVFLQREFGWAEQPEEEEGMECRWIDCD